MSYKDARATLGLANNRTAIFEGERAYGGNIYRSKDHSARMIKSAELKRVVHPFDVATIERAKSEVLAANDLQNGYIRAMLFSDEADHMHPLYEASEASLAVIITPWACPYPAEMLDNGVKVHLSERRRNNPLYEVQNAKIFNANAYGIAAEAKKDAKALGFHDAITLDHEGYVTELTVANLFFVKNNVLYTPLADGRFLEGITRDSVIKIAKNLGITVKETRITPELLLTADEAFGTGSATEITPICQIKNHKMMLHRIPENDLVDFRAMGKMTGILAHAYANEVRAPSLAA